MTPVPVTRSRMEALHRQAPEKSSKALCAIGFAAFASLVAAYRFAPSLYASILDLFSFSAWKYPFLDTEYVLAQAECWRNGIDVYVTTPCDPLHRPHDYSPLWLRIPAIRVTPAWLMALSFGQTGLFILSLLALPGVTRRWQFGLMVFATLSPATVFAVERGNPDLLMFVLVTTALTLRERFGVRGAAAYGFILLAGLLKFYPFAAMTVLARERLRLAVALGILLSLLFGLYIVAYHDEIGRMLPNVPRAEPFGDAFGAPQLVLGLVSILSSNLVPGVARSVVAASMTLVVLVSMVVVAAVARDPDLRTGCGALTDRQRSFLIVGASLTVGCFLAGSSSPYRAIHLLFALPVLLTLASLCPSRITSVAVTSLSVILVGLMCSLPFQRVVFHLAGPIAPPNVPIISAMFWGLTQLCWWVSMAALVGVSARALLSSTAFADLGHLISSAPRRT